MSKEKITILKDELFGDKATLFCVIFLGVIILASIFAFLSPYDPNATNIGDKLLRPSLTHFFGTDEVGRDYFTRALYGGRVSLTVGVLAMLVSIIIGVTVGVTSGYFGGIIDTVLMRIVDVLISMPWMIVVTVVGIFFRPGIQAIIFVIGVFGWMDISRIVRAETLSLKEREYVLYSVLIGQSSSKIMLYHIVLAAMPTIIVASTMNIASAIMVESTLSFLGMGVQQPMSSWGSMLQNAQRSIGTTPYMSIFPGTLILFTVFSFNKVGELLRAVIEPRSSSN